MAKRSNKGKIAVEVGLGLAIAAAAAGAYFFSGKQGRENRKKAKAWALKAQKEVLVQMKKFKEIDERAYHKVVDGVTKQYKALKHLDKRELDKMAMELKSHWKNIKKQLETAGKTQKRSKKPAKRRGKK